MYIIIQHQYISYCICSNDDEYISVYMMIFIYSNMMDIIWGPSILYGFIGTQHQKLYARFTGDTAMIVSGSTSHSYIITSI